VINAKVEGTINNSSNTLVTDPNKAFFARTVHRSHGPIIPPKLTYAPFKSPTVYHNGQNSLKGLFKVDLPKADFKTKKK
jgi:hypothetical protein